MKLDLITLKNRCIRAHRMGWVIASASQYVTDLKAELRGKFELPRGVKAGSPAHLVALIEAVQSKKSPPLKISVFEVVSEEVQEPEEKLVEVELLNEPEPEEGVEIELLSRPELEEGVELEVLSYGEMTYQQLCEEVANRNITRKRGKSKVELLSLLKKDDDKN